MYVISRFLTIPGTETKVTPEIEVPIIATATTYHFDDLLALKKVSFPDPFLLVRYDISISTPKYTAIIIRIKEDCIRIY
jgi:hypothetical protein